MNRVKKNKKLLKAAKRLKTHCGSTYCVNCIFAILDPGPKAEHKCSLSPFPSIWDISNSEVNNGTNKI